MSNFVQRRIEERTHGDGRIVRPGRGDRLEQVTHIDFNRNGYIGQPPPPAHPGMMGRIEQRTHVDLNRDGYIGGGPGYYQPPHPHVHHFHLGPQHPHLFHLRH